MTSAARNMCGYFSGLSSPSVTERITTLARSPRSNIAGQTRFPTFSIKTTELGAGLSSARPRARGANALAVIRGRLVAFDHIELQFPFQIADGALQQRGLAGTG